MRLIFGCFLLLYSFSLYSAIDYKQSTLVTPPEVEEKLSKNLEDRLQWLRESSANPSVFEKVAFGNNYHLQDRWRALYSLIALKGNKSTEYLARAFDSEDWFMRDAALKASLKYSEPEARKKARQLVKLDPSLIVRTTAVKILHQLRDLESEELLWEELYNPINFRKSQSLWIRKYMIRALSSFQEVKSQTGSIKNDKLMKFAKILKEEDTSLHPYALKALESMTVGKNILKKSENQTKKQAWLDWLQRL